jgi:uncharacterized protein (TIGR03905 family)
MKHFEYKTRGVCSQRIMFDLDGNVVHNVEFVGGCNGNLKGISTLVDGMTVEDIETKIKGTACGNRPTSCPDQLATAVRLAYDSAENC